MPIKNYTSTVPVERSLAKIESALVRGGARSISRDYDDKRRIVAFKFTIPTPNGQDMYFRLPANVPAVYEIMQSDIRRPRKNTMVKLTEQAERTAWKLMVDWVEIQMALVAMDQVDAVQVFLPYAWDGHQTFYERLKMTNFSHKLLPIPESP